jgi:hypothetical protein
VHEALQEALHTVEGAALLALLTLCVAGIRYLTVLARAKAAEVQHDLLRRVLEQAITWVEAHVQDEGPAKLRAAIELAEQRLGCQVDEAEVEAALARLKAEGVVP